MGSELIGLIPAAGRGTRMGQLGEKVPKALIEVQGVTLLEQSIEKLKALDVSQIVIIVSRRSTEITEYLNDRDFGVKIKFVQQTRPLGLADAIASAQSEITGHFVVLCPDNVFTDETDLIRAHELFKLHEPTFVLLTTVQPSCQTNRQSYYLTGRKKYGPNLFDYSDTNGDTSGLAVNSTGCVFFSHEAMRFLPNLSSAVSEHIFRDYLESIARERTGLIYILRGARYDFSTPEDVQNYEGLMVRFKETRGKGVSAILINEAGQVLLQQRDDIPSIRYPGHWALFGGSMEDGEAPAEAVEREVYEEIGFNLDTFGLFREFVQNNKREFAFVGTITANLEELSLNEGQAMNFFAPADLKNLLIRPDDRDTLEEYFGK